MKKRVISLLLTAVFAVSLICGCGSQASDGVGGETVALVDEATCNVWKSNPQNIIDDKYRTFYEVFLYSYYDSNGDGIGDINGLIEKLDYLNDGDDTTTDDLGINGIWLMPIMQSPSYHKYDTTDYMTVDEQYGTNEDFENLIAECHKRGINVIIDLAMNHSSNEHPWFQEAYSYIQSLADGQEPDASECKYVDYYNFTKEQQGGYTQVEGTDYYYESEFTSTMPDFNLENPEVQQEFENIASYWLGLGVDGFRLDAVKYFEYGDSDACIDTLSWFNSYVKDVNPDAYIVCECWDTQDQYAKYYESGVDSMFDFAFADQSGIIANVVNGKTKATGFVNALVEEEELYSTYSDSYIIAPFYTNHDMDRSAGYYPGDEGQSKCKIAQAMNLLSTGNCFIYYGEELGMKGSRKDENKRAPMQWSSDSSAEGMCTGPENMDDVEMKYGSLEDQLADEYSIYNYVKNVILLRNQNPEIARGTTENLSDLSDTTIAAMKKTYEGSEIYIIMNIGNEAKTLDISSLGDLEIVGDLEVAEGDAVLEEGSLSLNPYSVVALKAGN